MTVFEDVAVTVEDNIQRMFGVDEYDHGDVLYTGNVDDIEGEALLTYSWNPPPYPSIEVEVVGEEATVQKVLTDSGVAAVKTPMGPDIKRRHLQNSRHEGLVMDPVEIADGQEADSLREFLNGERVII